MKHGKILLLMVVLSCFIGASGLFALDKNTLAGSVYDSSWGPVYLAVDADGEWVFVYTYSDSGRTRYGIMDGEMSLASKEKVRTFELVWREFDPDFTKGAEGTVTLVFQGSLTFAGTWYNASGQPGGEWNGTFKREMTKEDLTLVEKILEATGY